jgi:F-type H+-transporting ATPase subunit gamma
MKGQDLKHRITGAKETVQITGAMQLISASKMSRTRKKLDNSRAFLEAMEKVAEKTGDSGSSLMQRRAASKTVYVVIAGDKGLCGDYNHAVLDFADRQIEKSDTVKVYAVGQYCREHFDKMSVTVSSAYIHMMQEPFIEDAKMIADDLTKAFTAGECDDAFIIYTSVSKDSVSKCAPVLRRVLPVQLPEQADKNGFLETRTDIDYILEQYIWARIYYSLCSASFAINYKRMTAMQQATTNGGKLAEELQSRYNHMRQENITAELIDAGIAKQGRRL